MFRPDPKPEKKPKKIHKKIRHLSIKRERQNKEYLAKRKVFLENNPICQLRLDGCTHKAIEVHHSIGRIGNLLTDERYFQAVCRNCHRKHHDS